MTSRIQRQEKSIDFEGEETGTGKEVLMRKAVIIGIDDYPSHPLSGCVNDAKAMNDVLGKHGDSDETLNFATKLVTSDDQKVTKSLVRKSVNQLFSGDPEIALLYFSGHGFINNIGGSLVTTDTEVDDEGVLMDTILDIANQSEATNKVIILDCCHAGAMGSPSLAGKKTSQLSEGLSVLTASRDSEKAIEVAGKGGVFTSLLIDALKGGASDIRGNITTASLYAYVDEALDAFEQRPIFKTNVASFSPIRKVQPKVPIPKLRKVIEYFPEQEVELQLDPSFEFTEESADPDNVVIFKDLQKYQSVGLVVPVGEEFMYFAAMNSKSCRLTALGYQYWRLVKEGKI